MRTLLDMDKKITSLIPLYLNNCKKIRIYQTLNYPDLGTKVLLAKQARH